MCFNVSVGLALAEEKRAVDRAAVEIMTYFFILQIGFHVIPSSAFVISEYLGNEMFLSASSLFYFIFATTFIVDSIHYCITFMEVNFRAHMWSVVKNVPL